MQVQVAYVCARFFATNLCVHDSVCVCVWSVSIVRNTMGYRFYVLVCFLNVRCVDHIIRLLIKNLKIFGQGILKRYGASRYFWMFYVCNSSVRMLNSKRVAISSCPLRLPNPVPLCIEK